MHNVYNVKGNNVTRITVVLYVNNTQLTYLQKCWVGGFSPK